MTKTIKTSISLKHNKKLQELLELIKKDKPCSRVSKQRLIEHSIEKITQEDAMLLADQCMNKRALILDHLRKDKELSNPQALISILSQ